MRFVIYLIIFIAIILTGFFAVIDYLPARIIPVLAYEHISVGDEAGIGYVNPRNFEWQIKYLIKNKIEVISLEKLIALYNKKEIPEKKKIVLTFERGYEDFYTNAFPFLVKYKMPAVVFLVPYNIGQPGYLNLTQIEKMKESGLITFGSNGMQYRPLTDIPQQEAFNDIFHSRMRLEDSIKSPVKYFCYPFGRISQNVRNMVKQGNYVGALAISPGSKYSEWDSFAVRRTPISNKDTNVWFFRVKTWGNFVLVSEWIKEKINKK